MTSKYIIKSKNLNSIVLVEDGTPLNHDFKTAPTTNHPSGKDLIIQWVIHGQKGGYMSLSYKNNNGEITIVKQSKINNNNGCHQSGALFNTP